MSSLWSWFIIIITLLNIAGAWWLLRHYSKGKPGGEDTTGHVWDGDLREYNNPLPRWWMWLFYLTVIFALVYLILYPGLGNFRGMLGWTQQQQYENQVEQGQQKYAAIFDGFMQKDVVALVGDADAIQTGQRLFLNHCAACHGSDGGGARGFPNLRDSEWLYGGNAQAIQQTISLGRNGIMPAWGTVLGDAGVAAVVAYVQQISGQPFDAEQARAGQQQFQTLCAACHGADGKGNALFGAPDLTNDIWLYGGDVASLTETVAKGRNGRMPAHQKLLGDAKVHVLAAYVYSLSQRDNP